MADTGKVAQLLTEVPCTESTEKGRLAHVMAEVPSVPSTLVRCCTLFAEVFLVPRSLDPYIRNDVTGQRVRAFTQGKRLPQG